jgi:hypothetical protein
VVWGKVAMNEISNEPIIWIISIQHWPRVYLRAELIERGFDAVGFQDLEQALTVLYHPYYVKPQMIVLDLFQLGARQHEISALMRFAVPTMVLGGAVELNEERVKKSDWLAVIQRPVTIGGIADMVRGPTSSACREKVECPDG